MQDSGFKTAVMSWRLTIMIGQCNFCIHEQFCVSYGHRLQKGFCMLLFLEAIVQ